MAGRMPRLVMKIWAELPEVHSAASLHAMQTSQPLVSGYCPGDVGRLSAPPETGEGFEAGVRTPPVADGWAGILAG
jgi:hypothetical protein